MKGRNPGQETAIPNPKSATLSIDSMTCVSCAGRVDRALNFLEGEGDVSVNLASETAHVSIDKPRRMQGIATMLDELGYPARRASVTLNVASMSCASCVGRVNKALAAVPGVLDVNVNLAAETATISYLEGTTDAAALVAAATDAGYPAEVTAVDTSPDRAARKGAHWRRNPKTSELTGAQGAGRQASYSGPRG
ncbi:heavy-metal-associated domain-containing protein [Aliiroseovarius crassostreae]|uniref:heavy-metal-associated domain-containing protein n=1 Tax=Aliiroseovarius crassostreae TaxID=154981 RepID=UPI00405740AE